MSQPPPPSSRFLPHADLAILDPELPPAAVREAVAAAARAGCAGVRLLPAMLDQLSDAGAAADAGAGAGRSRSELTRGLRVGVVCGYPTGRSHILVKAAEARLAAEHGAHDVAVVLDRAAVAAGDVNAVLSEVVALRGAVAAPTQLTAVIEGAVHAEGLIDDATFDDLVGAIAAGGADAIATATGVRAGAAPGAGQILRIRAAAPGLGVIAVIGGGGDGVGELGEPDEPGEPDALDAGAALAAGAHVVQIGQLPEPPA